jgi:hypothetical protein
MLSVTAAVLIVLSQVMRLGVNRLLGPGQIHLGNPHFAHSAFRRAWPLTDATTDLIPATR